MNELEIILTEASIEEIDKAIALLQANNLSDKEISKKFHVSRKRALRGTFPNLI